MSNVLYVQNLEKKIAAQAAQISALEEERTIDEQRAADLMAQVGELASQIAVLLAYLGNLLALIHRDGGQHQTDVGTEQAVKDAEDVWLSLRESHDAQAAQITLLRKALMDSVAHLSAATSAYEKYVGRHDRRGVSDPLFITRYSDYLQAEERGRKVLLSAITPNEALAAVTERVKEQK